MKLFFYLGKLTISLIWVIFSPLYPRDVLETTVLNTTLQRLLSILTLTFHWGPVRRPCFSVYKSVSEDRKLVPPLVHSVVSRVSQATATNPGPSNSHQFSPLTTLPSPPLPAGHPDSTTDRLTAVGGEDGQS